MLFFAYYNAFLTIGLVIKYDENRGTNLDGVILVRRHSSHIECEVDGRTAGIRPWERHRDATGLQRFILKVEIKERL